MKEISWSELKSLAASYEAAKGTEKDRYTLLYGMVRIVNDNQKFVVDDRNPVIVINEIRRWKDWD